MTFQIPEPDLSVFLKRYVYNVADDEVIDLYALPCDAAMALRAFKNLTASCLYVVKGPKGGEKTVKTSTEWLADPRRITVVTKEYAPGKSRLFEDDAGVPRYNSFMWPRHADVEIAEPDAEVFLDHLAYLIKDPEACKLLIQWFAHIVQHPEERPKIVPLIVAHEHGTGRGWITELMVRVLGLHNTGTTKLGLLAGEGSSGQYDNVLIKTLLATIHETKVKDKSWTIDDQVRDKLTEPHLQLNAKYGSFDVQRVYSRFLMYSNHSDAVRIPPEDRRVWVLLVEAEPRDEAYYKRIYGWLEGEGPAHVFWYLKNVDLSDFNPGMRAPMTLAKQAMITETQTSIETDLRDSFGLLPTCVDLATWDQVKRLVSLARSEGLIEDTGQMRNTKYDVALRHALTEAAQMLTTGSKDNKLRWRDKPVRVYALRNRKDWLGEIAPDQVRKHLDALEEYLVANNRN